MKRHRLTAEQVQRARAMKVAHPECSAQEILRRLGFKNRNPQNFSEMLANRRFHEPNYHPPDTYEAREKLRGYPTWYKLGKKYGYMKES